jgi:hypothetical protein
LGGADQARRGERESGGEALHLAVIAVRPAPS